jgi:enoyl-CoA hydratase
VLDTADVTSSPDAVAVELEGAIARLVLNRPEAMNCIDDPMHAALTAAFEEVARLDTIRCVVFASTGKAFSAGGDFDFVLKNNASLEARRHVVRDGLHLIEALLRVPVPIVVALHGDALGVGASLVLACEAVVAHPGARLADPHVALGLVAGDGGCLVWPQAAGMLMAKRYLLTGDALDARTAQSMGLVTDLVDKPEDVLPAAMDIADRIASLPPLAVQGTKATLNRAVRHRFDEVMELGLLHEVISLGSDDVREAVAAFRERRRPQFKSR